nr:MAG TPA: hypothetical protein [Caudoviricetes sp.]
MLWLIIRGRLLFICHNYGWRSASLVFNCSGWFPGFISSALYRFLVLSLVDLCRRKSRSCSRLQ